ncbi:hypothetical protein GU700_08470 [Methylobacterium sp. NI91]|nr:MULTISPECIES: AIPR family protein [unclassified Methylobacterium]QIJ74608.1 hypothetical protein CLZ_08470 [Methylobacterium sp. CLZ]QIJ79513.1 hypothetical protein GU700_08470 [Methylobacterium sp. NI91]
MNAADLEYDSLTKIIAPYVAKGLPESAAFLDWFLEHIFRLDDVEAQDSICDTSNDKGIDGIYVDDFSEEIVFFQTKIKQNPTSTLGDSALKEFCGSIAQFDSPTKIDAILSGNANAELKKLISSQQLRDKLEKGYALRGVFVCNQNPDDNATQYLSSHPHIRLYDKQKIASEFIDLSLASGVRSKFSFNCEQAPLELAVTDLARLYLFAAQANELVKLPGISDGQLFSQNVRLSLGNTEVNRAISKTLRAKDEHKKFPLFHNGITLLCDSASYREGKIDVENFVVVNGAQSLTALYHGRNEITSDLRFLLRVIEVSGNEDLSKQITLISNNQNAIKPRDLRSNHQIQVRLKREFEKVSFEDYVFEVKRGEENSGKNVISNEEAGRLLLAFDLGESWYCHQIYKVFDEYYTRIFGRPEVSAKRIVFMHMIMQSIRGQLGQIENQPFANYTLTRFFLLDVVAQILRKDKVGAKFVKDPSKLLINLTERDRFLLIIREILNGVIVDLNYEVKRRGEGFDYKPLLKTSISSRELAQELIETYERDVARGKAETVEQAWKKASMTT